RRRAHITNQSENLILFVELFHRRGGPRRLIAVVRCDEPKLAAIDSAIGVGRVEGRLDAELHVLAEFFGWTLKCPGNSEANFTVSHVTDRCRGFARAAKIGDTRRRAVCRLRTRLHSRSTRDWRTRLSGSRISNRTNGTC